MDATPRQHSKMRRNVYFTDQSVDYIFRIAGSDTGKNSDSRSKTYKKENHSVSIRGRPKSDDKIKGIQREINTRNRN